VPEDGSQRVVTLVDAEIDDLAAAIG